MHRAFTVALACSLGASWLDALCTNNAPESIGRRTLTAAILSALSTASGVSILTAFMVLILAGSNDLIATHFALSINDITWVFRILLFVLPAITFWATKRIAMGLQRKDRELVLHGHESAKIVRFADGEYVEVHQPLDTHERWLRVQHTPERPIPLLPAEDANGVPRKGIRKDALRSKISSFFFEDRIEPVTPAELAAAHEHEEHTALGAGADEAGTTGLVGAGPASSGTALGGTKASHDD